MTFMPKHHLHMRDNTQRVHNNKNKNKRAKISEQRQQQRTSIQLELWNSKFFFLISFAHVMSHSATMSRALAGEAKKGVRGSKYTCTQTHVYEPVANFPDLCVLVVHEIEEI
eukprot:m.110303 g.110303  ORF g.110303 m.110303 type:complete len:112 (-) comp12743_c1_seq9:1937-2272(-)